MLMDFTTISKKVIEPGYLTLGAEPGKQIVGASISRFRHQNFQHKLGWVEVAEAMWWVG